jgi:microcystin-dependent protein
MAERGEVQAVAWMPLGSELTADAAIGALLLTVDNSVDFDEDGGTLDLDGIQYDYSTVDHDSGLLTLESALTVAAVAGDRVNVWSGGQVAIEYTAFVSLGDGDEIEVPIPYGDRDLWPEGEYDNPVLVNLADDLESMTGVPGRTPFRDGTFIDPETLPEGPQGIPGPPGADGTPQYTWVKYADTPTTGMSDLPTGKAYLGLSYNHVDPTESANYSDYQWSLILGPQGAQGVPGVAGPTGADGNPNYTWVKYADTVTGTGMDDLPTGKAYIGLAYNKTTAVESTVATDYAWSLILGPQGPAGSQGIPGPTGANGQPTYTWLKYADTPTTGMSDSPTGKVYMGLAYNKTTLTESSLYTDYDWSLIQGPQGTQGVQGPIGPNGLPTYTWIKYGTSSTGAGISDSPVGKTYMGIAYNKSTATESVVTTDYEWSLIQGPQGPTGPAGPTGSTGPASDGLPPTSSPAATVIGGIGALFVEWNAITNADAVTYDVHLSATANFTPSVATLATSVDGTSTTLRTLPDGTPLTYDDSAGNPLPYYVRIVARDRDPGAAPAGVQGTGSMMKVNSPDVAAEYVYAGTIVANQIHGGTITSDILVSSNLRTANSGQRVEVNSTGISLWAPDNITVLASLPTDPTLPVSIKGNAELDRTTINGNFAMRGTTNEVSQASTLALAGKVNNPLVPPTVNIGWTSVSTWIADDIYSDYTYGLTYYNPASNNLYATAISFYGMGISFFHPTVAGSGGYGGNASCPERSGTQHFQPIGGVVYHPATNAFYTLGKAGIISSGLDYWELRKYTPAAVNPTTAAMTLTAWNTIGQVGTAYPSSKDPVIGLDSTGTGVCVVSYDTASKLQYQTVNTTTLVPSAIQLLSNTATPQQGGIGNLGYTQRGTFDLGGTVTQLVSHRGGTPGVAGYTVTAVPGTRNANVDWPSANLSSNVRGGLFGGHDGLFHSLDASGRLYHYASTTWTTESSKWWAGYSLRDTTGVAHETGLSTKATFTMVKRANLTLTSPSIPNNGGVDDPDSVSFYLGRGATTPVDTTGMFLNSAPAAGVRAATLTSAVFTGTTSIANNFPTAGAAKVIDASGNTLMDAVGYSMFAPTGVIQMYGGSTPPVGWLLCDGRSTGISRTIYSGLFAVIGTTYGAGDGTTTFNLPNFVGRVPRGNTLLVSGGSDSVTMPDHTHVITQHDHGLGAGTTAAVPTGTGGGQRMTGAGQTGQSALAIQSGAVTGTNPPIGNIPAHVGVAFIIKT